MTRISKSGIDGISIQKRTLPSGTVTHRVRVLKPSGEYEDAGSYPTNPEARRAGIETLRRFNQEAGLVASEIAATVATAPQENRIKTALTSAPAIYFPPLCREYAQLQRVLDRTDNRAQVFDHIASGIDRAGIANMASGTFGNDVLGWLKGLKAGWSNTDPNWKGRRKANLEISNRYRNDLLEKIACVINYAMCKDGSPLLRSPLTRMPGTKRLVKFAVQNKLKPTFTIGELRALVSTEMEHDDWWLPACLLIYTGCRAQEAMFARWEWFDWEARVIRLQYSKDKHAKMSELADLKTGERVIPLQDELHDLLRPIASPHGFVIADEHMRTNGSIKHCKRTKEVAHAYTKPFRKYAARCGFKPSDRTVHSLRHNYAAIHLAMGKNFNDVMDALGHQDEETTLGYAKMRALFSTAVKDWTDHQYHLRSNPPSRSLQSSATGGH
jgi:integrase